MKNKEKWQPSKYVYKRGKLRASSNHEEVRIFSRLNTDIIARFYDIHIKEYAKGRLLDLGCGKVPLYEAYKDYIDDNICIDWANTIHESPYLDYTFDLIKKIPLSDNEFDTIILSDVLEHIKEPKLLWSEMSRLLDDNGILLMNVPFYYWLHEEPYDFFRYTKHALCFMAEDVGFQLIKLEPYGGAIEIITDIISKLIVSIPLIGKLCAKIIQRITWMFINTKVGNKISVLTSQKFPLGYILIAKKIVDNYE